MDILNNWYIFFNFVPANLENLFRNLSFIFLFAGMIYSWTQLAFDSLKNFKIGIYLLIFANISLTILLILRWIISGHFPLSNLYESLMFLAWSCTILHFILLEPIKIDSVRNFPIQNNIIGCITFPVALLMNAYASFSLPVEMLKATPLVPALQSNWLMMHVTVMILSYAALILGSLFSVAFLILTINQTEYINSKFLNNYNAIAENQQLVDMKIPTAPGLKGTATASEGHPFVFFNKINLLKVLDNYSYRIIGIGFSFLTIGILSGAVWANEAWGSYWSWDPKETWAFLTWLIYAIYLHTRLIKGWEGQKPAVIASLGFITVWICYLGVNLIGKGLHSYGFFNS